MRRPLLLLACTGRKVESDVEIGALELYDGPSFRTLRASGYPTPEGPRVRVAILSAEHAILSPYSLVRPYDRRMDPERAAELAAIGEYEVRKKLFVPARCRGRSFEHFPASEVFVFGGALYRQVVEAWEAAGVFSDVPGGVSYSSGGIGVQLGQLKRWLQSFQEPRPARRTAR